jgi:hypothetical protein
MEPFKALTFLAAVGIVSFVGAGAAGFYAGYSAGRGNLEEIKAQIANAPAPGAVAAGNGNPVSLKPVLEDIRALSKQVEALAAVKARPVADPEPSAKPVLEEIKALSRQIDSLKASAPAARAPAEGQSASAGPDYTDVLQDIRDQIRGLRQEPKAPKALVDEVRLLSASVQAQEPNTKRAIADEVRGAVATLQNAEAKLPKPIVDEIRNISANVRAQDARPQVSVVDQIKVLAASIESLKSRMSSDTGRSAGSDSSVGAEVAQLRQLVAAASDQFGKCQAQLVSLAGSGGTQVQLPSAPAANTVSVSQTAHREPSTVVFFDNVMLKKNQEKQYDEIGVRLALQSVGPRQVSVAVNRQGFGLAFGERKVFRSQDVECELNLMETNLNDAQARVSISCKR